MLLKSVSSLCTASIVLAVKLIFEVTKTTGALEIPEFWSSEFWEVNIYRSVIIYTTAHM